MPAAPKVPAKLKKQTVGMTGKKAVVRFAPVALAESYTIRCNSANAPNVTRSVGQPGKAFKGLQRYTTYTCKVRADNDAGAGAWSPKMKVITY